jgi:hypothetical protein
MKRATLNRSASMHDASGKTIVVREDPKDESAAA